MATDDFHKSSDGIPRQRKLVATMEDYRGSARFRMVLITYGLAAIIAVPTAFGYYAWRQHDDAQRQHDACTHFLDFQSYYSEFLFEVDTFTALVASGAFMDGRDPSQTEPLPFSSQAALTIELSDPFGVWMEANSLSEHMREVTRDSSNTFDSVSDWMQVSVALRDAFVSAVQSANRCTGHFS